MLSIVQSVLAGQTDAFDEIVFRYRDQVYSAAWRLTRNHEDAMDVTQEALIRAYNALSSYKGRSRFSTWLHRVVLNTGIDYLRREKRYRHEDLEQTQADNTEAPRPRQESAVDPTQRDSVYQAELQGHVLAALDLLSTRQKQVFMLRYYHELDTRETAKILKCTEGSVKRHLFRAQQRLKELLRDLGLPNHGR